jgi:GntR family transcriptional repressor for pyruvate dehydrogenase complex
MIEDTPFALSSVTRPPKLSELVASQLKDAILKQVFGPGDLFPSENELGTIFSVSRSVVREALLILSSKGFIDILKGKGAVVLKPSIDNVIDPFSQLVDYKCGKAGLVHILSVRQMIEPKVAALSAQHRSEADLERLQEAYAMMQAASTNQAEMSHYDIHFHNLVSRSCNNPLVPIVLEPIFHVLAKFHPSIFFDAEIVRTALEYHGHLLQDIRDKNADQAYRDMEMHLKITEEHNLRLYHKQLSMQTG